MTLLYYNHPDCLAHEMQTGHPERPDRLRAIAQRLEASGLMQELDNREAPEIDPERLTGAHRPGYLDALKSASPASGLVAVDPDTSMGPFSLQAARRAAGAVVEATSQLLAGKSKRAFCAVRPPGHPEGELRLNLEDAGQS